LQEELRPLLTEEALVEQETAEEESAEDNKDN
jgi:hypothetical protein